MEEPGIRRKTLKLKAVSKRAAPTVELPKAPRPHKAVDWADDHKRRMQADMDALGFGLMTATKDNS